MINIKLTIEYVGTNYSGWQRQNNSNSIQEEIERAIKEITAEEVDLIGSGRTDKGVHALGQVANFLTNSRIPADRFKFALNSILPEDISIIESEEVDINFHSRYNAIGKRYKYCIYNRNIRNPLYRDYAYHVPWTLDHEEMEKGIKHFIGTYDFAAFMSSNSSVKSTIRTINKFTLEYKDDLMVFTIEGNGFLYNMIRIIIGTLVDLGRGRIKSEEIPIIIESKNRRLAGHTAPPQGLYLVKVFY